MIRIKIDLEKDFIIAIKSNRTAALSEEDKHQGSFSASTHSNWKKALQRLFVSRDWNFPVRLVKQVFKNKDGSCGELFIVCSDLSLSFEEITTLYQKRWKIEEFHKSVKSNASLAKSPARTVRTQSNHCFAAVYAFLKLEKIKIRSKPNHFSIKSQIYTEALKTAYDELEKMSGAQNRLALV